MVSSVCRKRWDWTMRPFTSWTATWTLKSMAADCMENDHVIETEFGRLRRLDPPFPEQTQGSKCFSRL